MIPRNLHHEIDTQDDQPNMKALLGPNSSLDDKAVEAVASEKARKLLEIRLSASSVLPNAEASVLVQIMSEIVVSMREISQSNKKVLDMYHS